MRLPRAWHRAASLIVLLGFDLSLWAGPGPLGSGGIFVEARGWSLRRKRSLRDTTSDLWNHGFNNYMNNAFPYDELMPLSCSGRGPDWNNIHNIAYNDVAGNFSLTLVDVLDTFVVMGDTEGFSKAVANVIDWVSFDVNTRPQVFETTIRVLGGLLSGHIFAADEKSRFYQPWYRGQLLDLASDLGNRMLPAFNTPTGIPYARLNLRHGVLSGETHDTCTAGAGSLILEFGTLSRLTGDPRFEKAAYKAFFALWNRKSDIGLVGNTINHYTGKWLSPEVTGIGAGIDSFFEYAFKWFVLSGEVEFLDVWHEAYAAIMRYSRGADGFWFRPVSIHSGDAVFNTVDSLSAFWPGLQVLAGDIENAIKSHLIYWNLWKRHSGLPEVWDIKFMQAVATQYPLRPEFIESTYYLYRATRDPFYLDVGERILNDLILRSKVPCGLTGIADLRINKRDDRMESFVLSETLKYLFLLFDEDNALHKDDSNFVFTTEGHILALPYSLMRPLSPVRRKLRRSENLQCPVYQSPRLGVDVDEPRNEGLLTGVLFRPDIDYVRVLVGTTPTGGEEAYWSPYGTCEVPTPEIYSYDFILSPDGRSVPEDLSPGLKKLYEVDDGFVLQNVTGIRAHIVSRLDGKGYDVVKLAQYPVRRGQYVYINDSALRLASADPTAGQHFDDDGFPMDRSRDIPLRLYLNAPPTLQVQPAADDNVEMILTSFPASFGGNPSTQTLFTSGAGPGIGSRLSAIPSNELGCREYSIDEAKTALDTIVLARRGACTFIEKLAFAKRAGSRGVIVISDDDTPINPSADEEEIHQFATDKIEDAVLVLVKKSDGDEIRKLLKAASERPDTDVLVTIEPEGQVGKTEASNTDESGQDKSSDADGDGAQGSRILYLNGHPLQNTRLLI